MNHVFLIIRENKYKIYILKVILDIFLYIFKKLLIIFWPINVKNTFHEYEIQSNLIINTLFDKAFIDLYLK
jgi:hypothetical protein